MGTLVGSTGTMLGANSGGRIRLPFHPSINSPVSKLALLVVRPVGLVVVGCLSALQCSGIAKLSSRWRHGGHLAAAVRGANRFHPQCSRGGWKGSWIAGRKFNEMGASSFATVPDACRCACCSRTLKDASVGDESPRFRTPASVGIIKHKDGPNPKRARPGQPGSRS